MECKFKWEVTNGVITNNNGTTYEANFAGGIGVKWNNVNAAGKVKVTVSNGPNCSSCPSGSKEITLTIKYLGSPSPIQLNSVSYTGSRQWPCNTTPITVSVDPVTNATNYDWSWPSGWSGPSTSTSNSVTVTPNLNSQGTIKVDARRSDVSDLKTSRSLNITRPLPSISSVSLANILLCNTSSTQTLSASGTNSTSYIWEPSTGVKINGLSSTVNSSSAVSVSTVSSGNIIVRGYSSSCAVQSQNSQTVQVGYGAPAILQRLVNGVPECCYPQEVPNGSRIAIPSSNATSYTWTLLAGTAPITPVSGNTHMCDVGYIIDYARIEGKANNSCGSASHLFYLVPPGGALLAYPNPSSETLTLEFSKLPEIIALYSEHSTFAVKHLDGREIDRLKSKKGENYKVDIDVRDLPRGNYYLHLEREDKKTEKVKIILE